MHEHARHYIRTINDVEVPAAGRWRVTAVDHSPARRVNRVSGELVMAEHLGDSRIALTLCGPGSRTPDAIQLAANLVHASRTGRWRFEGTATTGEKVVPVGIDVLYHGVFPRVDGAIASLSLSADIDLSPPARRLRIGGSRRSLRLDVDLNADSRHVLLPILL